MKITKKFGFYTRKDSKECDTKLCKTNHIVNKV